MAVRRSAHTKHSIATTRERWQGMETAFYSAQNGWEQRFSSAPPNRLVPGEHVLLRSFRRTGPFQISGLVAMKENQMHKEHHNQHSPESAHNGRPSRQIHEHGKIDAER